MTVERAGATALAYGLLIPAVSVSLARVPITAVVHAVAGLVSGDAERLHPEHLTDQQRTLFFDGGDAA
jgi:hypothetical protein